MSIQRFFAIASLVLIIPYLAVSTFTIYRNWHHQQGLVSVLETIEGLGLLYELQFALTSEMYLWSRFNAQESYDTAQLEAADLVVEEIINNFNKKHSISNEKVHSLFNNTVILPMELFKKKKPKVLNEEMPILIWLENFNKSFSALERVRFLSMTSNKYVNQAIYDRFLAMEAITRHVSLLSKEISYLNHISSHNIALKENEGIKQVIYRELANETLADMFFYLNRVQKLNAVSEPNSPFNKSMELFNETRRIIYTESMFMDGQYTIDKLDWFKVSDELVLILKDIQIKQLEPIKNILQKDLEDAKLNSKVTMIIATATLLGMILSIIFMNSVIFKPMRHATKIISQIAEGNTNVHIGDEPKGIELRALRNSTISLIKRVNEAFKLENMVMDMPTNVLLIKKDYPFNVIYSNQSSQDNFRLLFDDNAIDINNLTLSGIPGVASKFERAILENKNVFTARVRNEILRFDLNQINDSEDGQIIIMASWFVITQKEKTIHLFKENITSAIAVLKQSVAEITKQAMDLNSNSNVSHSEMAELETNINSQISQIENISQFMKTVFQTFLGIQKTVDDTVHQYEITLAKSSSAQNMILSLSQSSEEISRFVEKILAISKQINLLALNAAIEATKADHQHKNADGFAVVASEVKNLAFQTASVSENIIQLIETIQSSVKECIYSIKEMSEAIAISNELSLSTKQEISKQVKEITVSIASLNKVLLFSESVSSKLNSFSDITAKSINSSKVLFSYSNKLDEQAKTLSVSSDEFLKVIQSA
ncbi:hypothetical protein C7B61_00090 [filamentous cyanobacterium CCP1]|nr:hypothetical protein C7B61_00090 [filamentous cyanobacterium CCP1]